MRKALGLLAIMMLAGMAYLAFSSHGSVATIPSLSMDAYTTHIGERCRYAAFKDHAYISFETRPGPLYIWKNHTPEVLIIEGADSILLNTASGRARHWSGDKTYLDPSVAQTYAIDWYTHQIAVLGIYSHLMAPANKSFLASAGNTLLKVQHPQATIAGSSYSVWSIDKTYLPLSCDITIGGDSLHVQWQSWQWTPDSLLTSKRCWVNQKAIVYSQVKVAAHTTDLGYGKIPDF